MVTQIERSMLNNSSNMELCQLERWINQSATVDVSPK